EIVYMRQLIMRNLHWVIFLQVGLVVASEHDELECFSKNVASDTQVTQYLRELIAWRDVSNEEAIVQQLQEPMEKSLLPDAQRDTRARVVVHSLRSQCAKPSTSYQRPKRWMKMDNKEFKCLYPGCERTTRYSRNMQRHYRQQHTNAQPSWKCDHGC